MSVLASVQIRDKLAAPRAASGDFTASGEQGSSERERGGSYCEGESGGAAREISQWTVHSRVNEFVREWIMPVLCKKLLPQLPHSFNNSNFVTVHPGLTRPNVLFAAIIMRYFSTSYFCSHLIFITFTLYFKRKSKLKRIK